jgi:hypothetical protein
MKDNMQDSIQKGRFKYNIIKSGEQHPRSKLTDIIVRRMRLMREDNKTLSYQKIADLYGVAKKTAMDAIKGVTWRHI